ncbi:ataxin-3-like protein [Iris pallida]|uniref:ubiquitinyl hydrolase 1 n=1 Tax=Iris pallida TaxID=29817 RepID=A0AAX6EF27_IRIPA|nr:ataxin-3-like protein [Iris pallida]
MEEGPSNGGLLYHEVQESKLCAVHCVNTLLQGPFFSEVDLAALASDLDQTERQMMMPDVPGGGGGTSGDFSVDGSHNVSLGGDFSIQVLEKALGVWDLQVIPLNSPAAEASKYDPELENAFICHLHNHWFCIRKVNGEWYNFNSLYAAPEHLSKFYLSAFLDTLKGSGWSIFLVRGNFPKDCPISSSAFGQWLTPEDAKRMIKSCNETQVPIQRQNPMQSSYSSQFINEADAFAAQEEHDLNAAIAASLMDSAFTAGAGTMGYPAVGSQSGVTESSSDLMEDDLDAAIAASLASPSAFITAGVIEGKGKQVGSAAVGPLSGVKEGTGKLIEDPAAVIAASSVNPSAFSSGTGITEDKSNPAGAASIGSQAGATASSINLVDDQTETGESKDTNLPDPAVVSSENQMGKDEKLQQG